MSRSRDLANLAGDATGLETLTVSDITDLTATATELNKLDGVTATTAELNYVDGVSSALQTQIDAKAPTASPTFTGTTNVSSGVTLPSNPTIVLGSNATFPSNVPTEILSITHTTASGNQLGTGTHFGTALTVSNLLDGESLLITISGGYALQGTSYARSSACGIRVNNGTANTIIMGGYAYGLGNSHASAGIAQGKYSNTSGSTYSSVTIHSFVKSLTGSYGVWSSNTNNPITITSIRYKT